MKQLVILILLLHGYAIAQNQVNNWYFGVNAGITFNTNPPSMLTGGQINTNEGCASMSDSNGNLLFYSDGITIWDSTHAVMQNGTGLLGNTSSTQSCLIVPLPGISTLYYLFTTPAIEGPNNPLAYSIIDMALNGGLGSVTVKNVSLLDSSTEKITAVYHQNGTDIWVISHDYPNNNFYAFLLTASGLNPVSVISAAGNPITTNTHKAGYLKASPCGNQLAMAYSSAGSILSIFTLFDFNDSTGVVSNALQLGQWAVSIGVYGVEFSPDNSKLYASFINPSIVIQYDLLAGSPAAIIASMDTIGISSSGNGALQTGPDGKIYLVKYGLDSLDCVTNPNQQGSLCGYVENYVSLGLAAGVWGLPNFLTSFFCNISSGINEVNEEDIISIYPNPFGDAATLQISNDLLSRKCKLAIYDLLGHRVKQIPITNQHTALHKENLTSGIYFYVLMVKDEVVGKGKMVIE